ncbi:MAG TPA: hypothetical protein DCK95_10645 [Anaerolineaceae bacterium]|uniref:Uncharacterized protein n=1 Tax=Anaerolinea thermophila TaxID=167964 RepID=A0A101FZ41_9CHLR|nr:MAG: hypothetical protein XD73_0108 [Anaerolinea thermophila]HAF62766.1 hypothetical protein [Anaerolineaceae bacterium]
MSDKKNTTVYIIGSLAGALLGVGVAHALVKSSDESETPLQISPQKGMQIGINTIGFVRKLLDLLQQK